MLRRILEFVLPPPKRRKLYAAVLCVLVTAKFAWVPLYRVHGAELLSGGAREDLLERRRYLVRRAESMTLGDMPFILPEQFKGEWFAGTLSMTSAALVNLALRFPETRAETIDILPRLIEKMLSAEARRFDHERWGEDPLESLSSNRGHIGYLAHLAWMIGGYRILSGDPKFDSGYRAVIESLSRRIASTAGYCLETYPEERYLPDNVVMYAAIRVYDRIFSTSFGAPVDDWVRFQYPKLRDPANRLLPFRLDPACGPATSSRGSGAGWNAFYLPFIDRKLARDQMIDLKKALYSKALGFVPGVREYPKGVFGLGDVDSGPVILGLSPSGTGFSISTAVYLGDVDFLDDLLWTSEVVGSTVEYGGERGYLLAPLVGEAIVLAMKTATIWIDTESSGHPPSVN